MAYSSKAVAKITCGGSFRPRSTLNPSTPGICTSSTTRSGCWVSMSSIAAVPSPASPTSCTSGIFLRNDLTRSRASCSSSTTTVRIISVDRLSLGVRGPVGDARDADGDGRALALARPDLGGVLLAEEVNEAIAHVAKADAAVQRRLGTARDPHAGVADHDAQVAGVEPRLDRDAAALDLLRDAVPHGVLDERLEDQGRHDARAGGVVHLVGDAQPVAEARALDVEVGVDDLQLVRERDERAVLASEQVAEDLRQALDAALRTLGVDRDELRDRVQAVEEEMRVDLRAQGVELRGRRELARLVRARLEQEDLPPALVEPDDRHECDRHDREHEGDERREREEARREHHRQVAAGVRGQHTLPLGQEERDVDHEERGEGGHQERDRALQEEAARARARGKLREDELPEGEGA